MKINNTPTVQMTPYQEFIHMTRYSRWLPEETRRENWSETVGRYIKFFTEERAKTTELSDVLAKEIYPAILNMEVMPSMRSLMTAGPALKRENLAGYNCSYIAINNKRAFSEALYVLTNGAGVGFSCEQQEVDKLPIVPSSFERSTDVISVADSKEGWAKAYSRLLSSLYLGDVPEIDYSKVRPEGAKLKTFGGRASGPAPLKRLFDFTISTFKRAAGRRLNSIEVHDIMCTVGEVVVVGGVRRSALISLSNLDNSLLASAKSNFLVDQYSLINETDEEWVYTVTMKRGQPVNPTYRITLNKKKHEYVHTVLELEKKLPWYILEPQRALANNSVAYLNKPTAEVFMTEWLALVKSKSGERGIFNRKAAQTQAAKYGRRSSKESYGTNPCCFTGDTLIAVCDGRGAVPIQQLAEESNGEVEFQVSSAERKCTVDLNDVEVFTEWSTQPKNAIAKCTGEKVVVQVTLSNGDTFKCTDDHLFATRSGEYKMVKNLIGEKLVKFETTNPDSVYISNITPVGVEMIYDLQVQDNHNFYIITKSFDENHKNVRGVLVHNSEIILRDKQTCNLSEVIIRANDTAKTIKAKIRLATIIGTFQATLTDFGFVNETWRKNTEAEALLGVSMTGIMDNRVMAGVATQAELNVFFGLPTHGTKDAEVVDAKIALQNFLDEMRLYTVEVNKEWAKKLGINQSAAITCVKPSGTVSQLCDTASGLHARHNEHYIRTVRIDKKDPVYEMFLAAGMPMEDDMMKPSSVAVVSYPQVAPVGAITRRQLTAIEQLETWLIYQRHWCEHKPSVTISVGDDEWMEVGAWVFKYFDELSGVSFLPRSDHTYNQAPYQDKTAEELVEWQVKNPTPIINWADLSKFEFDDTTVSMQTLACVSGDCEI